MARTKSPEEKASLDWEAIESSPFARAYISEVYWLSRDTAETCQGIFENAPAPPQSSSYIKVDHGLHRELYRVLNNAARIRALIKSRPRSKSQGAGMYALQERRIKWLAGLLTDLPTAQVLHSKVRNTLEHFDEYLDETALKSRRGQISRPTLFPVDMTLGREGMLEQFDVGGSTPTVYPLRVYLAEERVFVNCGARLDLDAISSECRGITERLESIAPDLADLPSDNSDGRGSSMLVVTAQSFEGPAGG